MDNAVVTFNVISKENLPVKLQFDGNKYGPLFEAISKLNGKDAICVTTNSTGVAAYLSLTKSTNPTRLCGAKFAQRDGKLWIYHSRGSK